MKQGDTVAWRWGAGLAEGVIQAIEPSRTEIESKGKRIVRNGTPDNPALIIRHTSGTLVLKLASEVQKTSR
jgi:hypothetical protein